MKAVSSPHRYALSRQEQFENAWRLLKHVFWGVFLALGVAISSQILQVVVGDIAAWALVLLVIAAVLLKGRKPGRTMGRIFPK
jgi:ABC-type glycerol-3-phosphate transport system permease component